MTPGEPTHPATALALGGSFTIERAAELRLLLLEQLPAASELCLAEISEIDCAGLQLLLAAKRQQPALVLANASPAVRDLFARLSLSALLDA
jgi:anti-anti-sigma regulatory factor